MNKLKKHIASEKHFNQIADLAGKMNVKVYLVGGYVRDFILERDRNEMDVLVIGDGPNFAKELSRVFGVEEVTIYKNFGTAHFIYNGWHFEFVGARKESYSKDSRNPVVEEGTFEDDIGRRDFTINTLAVSLNRDDFSELIDTFNGLKDINNRLIKTPVDPNITFNDDPLRIMRAFRFASQLEFDVDKSIMDAASKLAVRMKILSQERITGEFLKILESKKPSVGLKLLYDSGVMDYVFPEAAQMAGVEQRKDHHHKDVFLHTCKVVDNIAEVSDNLWLRFAGLVHDIAKPLTKKFIENTGWTFHGHEEIGARMMKSIFKRMKLPFNKIDYVEKLVRLHLRPIALVDDGVTDSAIRRMAVAADEDLEDLITLCRADITSKNPSKVARYLNNYEIVMQKVRDVKERDQLRAFQSPVDGNTIMKICNLKPSRKVGEIKEAIEEAILDGRIGNNYDEAYSYLLEIKNSFLN
ncbi:CCA tRNA nucleotidyltransferase [Bacteroidota bacterium]